MASFVPQQVGEVKLLVFVNGEQTKGSPYSVIVRDYTSVNKPSKIVNNNGNMGQPRVLNLVQMVLGQQLTLQTTVCTYLMVRINWLGSLNLEAMALEMVNLTILQELHLIVMITCMLLTAVTTGYRSLLPMITYLLQLGNEAIDNRKIINPRGLAVHDHKVYVTECGNQHIQTDGKFHHTIGSGQLGIAYDVTINGNYQLATCC